MLAAPFPSLWTGIADKFTRRADLFPSGNGGILADIIRIERDEHAAKAQKKVNDLGSSRIDTPEYSLMHPIPFRPEGLFVHVSSHQPFTFLGAADACVSRKGAPDHAILTRMLSRDYNLVQQKDANVEKHTRLCK